MGGAGSSGQQVTQSALAARKFQGLRFRVVTFLHSNSEGGVYHFPSLKNYTQLQSCVFGAQVSDVSVVTVSCFRCIQMGMQETASGRRQFYLKHGQKQIHLHETFLGTDSFFPNTSSNSDWLWFVNNKDCQTQWPCSAMQWIFGCIEHNQVVKSRHCTTSQVHSQERWVTKIINPKERDYVTSVLCNGKVAKTASYLDNTKRKFNLCH